MQLATEQKQQNKGESMLSRRTSGRKQSPHRVLIYGPEKVGKSSFALGAPDPLFVDTEQGTDELDVPNRVQVHTWDEFMALLDEIQQSPGLCKTLVVDSVTSAERMAGQQVCAKAGKTALNEFAHGRGYTSVYAEWGRAMDLFQRIYTEQSINLVFVAHSTIATFKNPEGDDYDRYTIELSKGVKSPLMKWVTEILFANFEALIDVDKDTKQAKGVGGKLRVLYTQHRDAYDAGNRHNLPERLELSWQSFADALQAGERRTADLVSEITEAIESLGEKEKALAAKSLEACGDDFTKLSKLLNWTKSKQQEKQS